MTQSVVEQIADAILYEGYILYPYRASALKNGQRWNFGVLYPKAYADAQNGLDASTARCECLVRGGRVSIVVRFLHLVTRQTLDSEGKITATWQEAIARDVEIVVESIASIEGTPAVQRFSFPARSDREIGPAGEIVRSQHAVEGVIEVGSTRRSDEWFRMSVRISNCGLFDDPRVHSIEWSAREAALCHSLVSTHAILRVEDGEFASLLDPPDELRLFAAECKYAGLWPVLAGANGNDGSNENASDQRFSDAMLASPIILYDHPQIAPQSAGALFDGTEIDEILSLRILALTDQEKREMRDTDAQGRRILERTEALDPEQWMKLHGVMRGKDTEPTP